MRPAFYWDLPAALVLLTRLPMPRLPDTAFQAPARAVWSYPIVGLVLGALAALVWHVTSPLPVPIQAGLTLITLILMTGALHEDGLADTADGFWGSHTVTRRLEIMKDSQIGTYGVLALTCVTGLRWLSLAELDTALCLLVAASLSRAMMPVLMLLPQARTKGLAASVGCPPKTSVILSVMFGALPAVLTLPIGTAACVITAAAIAAAALAWLASCKINGVTGDVLGATQQLSETAILLALLVAL